MSKQNKKPSLDQGRLDLIRQQLNLETFQPINLDDLIFVAEHQPERKRLLGDMIKEGMHTAVAGQEGSMKSYMLVNWLSAVVSGKDSFFKEPIEKNGTVLLIDTELGHELTSERLLPLVKGAMTQKDLHGKFAYHDKLKNGQDSFFQSALDYIQSHRPVVVVLDNIKAGMGGDWTKEQHVVDILKGLKEVCRKSGSALVSVWHTRKHTWDKSTNMDLISGSGAISALVDKGVILRKSKTPGHTLMSLEKGRDSAEGDHGIVFRFDPGSQTVQYHEAYLKADEKDYLPSEKPNFSLEGMKESDKKRIAAQVLKGKMTKKQIAELLGVTEARVKQYHGSGVYT